MKKSTTKGNNFVDALEGDNKYAVLMKKRRVQILIEPSAKELRKRGKRAWHLYSTLPNSADARTKLLDMVARAISETEATIKTTSDEKKEKQSKHKSR